MAGKFRETVVQRSSQSVAKSDDKPTSSGEKPSVVGASQAPDITDINTEAQAAADTEAASAPELSQDAINAIAEAKAFREAAQREIGGPKGPEPTRFGDWEHKGRCIDF
ncbi:hypothetical protein TH25_02010 [Thalassospira profundimaris]|uniref:Dihydrodipicolinate reductase n=1 Tax=Thalassospira profundimaris TaxID=502049 RepID=A0A367XKP6_9PROT|nr:hypothetical protein TH25_02010 [Thalassospira profundimaris]